MGSHGFPIRTAIWRLDVTNLCILPTNPIYYDCWWTSCRVHEFRCTASNCKGRGKDPRTVQRYLNTSDRNSTGNLRKHAQMCWGDEILHDADACHDLGSAREGLKNVKKQKDGSITVAFKRTGKGKVTFSHRQHDKTQTRFVLLINNI